MKEGEGGMVKEGEGGMVKKFMFCGSCLEGGFSSYNDEENDDDDVS